MQPPRVILAGGSGFLGRALQLRFASEGFDTVALSRNPHREGTWTFHTPYSSHEDTNLSWDGKTVGDWYAALDGAEAVINLTGKSIDCRYTPENRKQILASRIDSVNVIAQAISLCKQPPKTWMQASAIAIYGHAGDKECAEDMVPFPTAPTTDMSANEIPRKDFSANVCKAWETAFANSDTPQTRKVAMRIAVVLDKKDGALPKLLKLANWGLGGQAGKGAQFFSWIHRRDFESAVLFLLENENRKGAFNLSSPEPLPNKDFMAAIRKALRRPWSPPVPAIAIEIGTRLLGTESELVLEGRRAIPKGLLDAGFRFKFPEIAAALTDLQNEPKQQQIR